MASTSKASEPSLRLLSHLLLSFVIVVILNPNETLGGPPEVADRPRNLKGKPQMYTSGGLDYQDILESEGSGVVTASPVSSDVTQGTEATSTPAPDSTSAKSAISKTGNYGIYTPFMKGMTSPLGEDVLEYSLDYYNEKSMVKEYDFNSTEIFHRLMDSAIAKDTSSNQFFEEIQDLISLQNRSKTEQDDSGSRDEASQLQPGFLSENLLKRMTEGWKNELKRLEKKYNVTAECTDAQSITPTRLTLMFPHYLNFGQKPFAAPSTIAFSFGSVSSTTSSNQVCEYDRRGRYTCHYGNNESNNNLNNHEVPSIFGRSEFSGLIPLSGSLFNGTVKEAIIGTHLYALHRNDYNDMVPFRTKCVMLKRRMQTSVLSDERRIRFLINNDIINKSGELLKTSLIYTYAEIPSDFKVKIDWDLL